MKALAALLAMLVVAVAVAPNAAAHAVRIAADPTEDAVLTHGPQRVRATFNEPLQTTFAAMTLVGPDGNLWSSGEPQVKGAVVSVAVGPLGPAGTYTANYRVTSADGHVVTGSWSFEVSTAGQGTPVKAASQPPAEGGGLPVWPFLAAAALVIAALAWWAADRVRKRT